ncbi:putative membrane protein (partial), partial [Candidatus Ichthyocystis hellenicum]
LNFRYSVGEMVSFLSVRTRSVMRITVREITVVIGNHNNISVAPLESEQADSFEIGEEAGTSSDVPRNEDMAISIPEEIGAMEEEITAEDMELRTLSQSQTVAINGEPTENMSPRALRHHGEMKIKRMKINLIALKAAGCVSLLVTIGIILLTFVQLLICEEGTKDKKKCDSLLIFFGIVLPLILLCIFIVSGCFRSHEMGRLERNYSRRQPPGNR